MNDFVDLLQPLITLVGFGVVVYNLNSAMKSNKRIDEKEVELRATAQAEVNITMREVSNDVKQIMSKLDKTEQRIDNINERLLIVESAKNENLREHDKILEDIKKLKEEANK